MIKLNLIFLIGVVSAFLLTVQWIILQMTLKNVAIKINHQWNLLNLVSKLAAKNKIPLFSIDAKILTNLASNNRKTQSSEHIDQEYKLSTNQISNLFESSSSNEYSNTWQCEFYCSGQKVTHLASTQEIVINEQLMKFIEQLRDAQLTVLEFNDFDTSLLAQNVHLHLVNHLIIFRDQYSNGNREPNANLIHITIFQERLKKFWISQSIHLTELEKRLIHRQGVRKLHFQFNDHSHVYEKVNLETRLIDGLLFSYPEQIEQFIGNQQKTRFIECNKTRAKQFYKTYGDDESENALQFKMNAYHLICKVKNILDELAIPFWLSSGTCLGYFRQCDFITYSQDVDIGIFITDYRDDLIDVFSINDLPLIHLFGKIEDSFELSFRNGDVKLDIFFFYEERDHYWNGGTQAKSGLKFKYRFPKFELCWTEFLDLLVRVPCNTQTYIEANYGENWFKPVKNWDWKSSPSNVQPNGQWSADEWHTVIQTNPYSDLV